MPKHTLTELTYVTSDWARVVPEDSPEAAYVLGGPGAEIDLAQAVRLGIVSAEAPSEPSEPATMKVDTTPGDPVRYDRPMYDRPATGPTSEPVVTTAQAGVLAVDQVGQSIDTIQKVDEDDDDDDDESPSPERRASRRNR